MLSVEEALNCVLTHVEPLPPENVGFDNVSGRLLQENIVSDIDLPPFARSAVDGYAVRSKDLYKVPTRFSIVGEVPAGSFPQFSVGPGEAAQIMTGAPVPKGADAVQMVEHSQLYGTNVEIMKTVKCGQNVAQQGSEVRSGDTVLRKGTRLDPAAVAVAATVGKTAVLVGKRPQVAIMATGNELVHPSQIPTLGQIRNSNGFSITAQSMQAGAETNYLGIAKDNANSLLELIRQGLESDVLLISGGVSMGRFDLVEPTLEQLGVELLFSAVQLKPGKPLVFGRSMNSNTLVFGLPGNPVSTMVTFELFVRVAIARLEGALYPVRPLLKASLCTELLNRGSRRAYLPGWIFADANGQLFARPIRSKGSGDIVAFSKANALLIVPEDRAGVEQGEDVTVYPLDSFLYKEDTWQLDLNQHSPT